MGGVQLDAELALLVATARPVAGSNPNHWEILSPFSSRNWLLIHMVELM
jgi:hypothetical protein